MQKQCDIMQADMNVCESDSKRGKEAGTGRASIIQHKQTLTNLTRGNR